MIQMPQLSFLLMLGGAVALAYLVGNATGRSAAWAEDEHDEIDLDAEEAMARLDAEIEAELAADDDDEGNEWLL